MKLLSVKLWLKQPDRQSFRPTSMHGSAETFVSANCSGTLQDSISTVRVTREFERGAGPGGLWIIFLGETCTPWRLCIEIILFTVAL